MLQIMSSNFITVLPASHLIQDFGIGLGQLHVHGVSDTGKFDGIGVLAVFLLI